ncbi:hypothetical protein DFH27DRAFT_621985 [Peziza echinospora]|nr:hypothetical protein DFH27DRAFT_621985 [Peziza echinospora]
MENLEKHLICPVCMDVYQTTPFTINCLHSFCANCLTRHMYYIYKKDEKTILAGAQDFLPACPVCRTIILWGKPNHALGGIVDVYISSLPSDAKKPKQWGEIADRKIGQRLSDIFSRCQRQMIDAFEGYTEAGTILYMRQVTREEYDLARENLSGGAGIIFANLEYDYKHDAAPVPKNNIGDASVSLQTSGEEAMYAHGNPSQNSGNVRSVLVLRDGVRVGVTTSVDHDMLKAYAEANHMASVLETGVKLDALGPLPVEQADWVNTSSSPEVASSTNSQASSDSQTSTISSTGASVGSATSPGPSNGTMPDHGHGKAKYFLLDSYRCLLSSEYQAAMQVVETWGNWFRRTEVNTDLVAMEYTF